MHLLIYYIYFEITGYPCSLIGSQQCDLFPNVLFFALNRIFISANENETVKQNSQSDFKAFLTN